MAHGEWATPLCNILIAPPEEREQCVTSRLRATTMLFKDYYGQDTFVGPYLVPGIQTVDAWPGTALSNVQWWGDPLNCYTLKPVLEPGHTRITYWFEEPILKPYEQGEALIDRIIDFAVTAAAEEILDILDVGTRLPDGVPRKNYASMKKVKQGQRVDCQSHSVSWGQNGFGDKLPARPCFRIEFSRYEADNKPSTGMEFSPCPNCSSEENEITMGMPHVRVEFGNAWKLIFDFYKERISLQKLWNVGAPGAPNNLWFEVAHIQGKTNPAARQMWQNQLIQVDVLHIGSHLVLAFAGDYSRPLVISPWHTMTVKGEKRYVGDSMATAGNKWKPFFRTPAAPVIVHCASCTPQWNISPIVWADMGNVSACVTCPEGMRGDLVTDMEIGAAVVLMTPPPPLAAVEDENEVSPRFNPGKTNGWVDWEYTQTTTNRGTLEFTLHRGGDAHNRETPQLYGANLRWALNWKYLGKPDWTATTDYRNATVRVVESSAEPLIGGIDSCEVTLEKVALDAAYPGWETTIKRYSPIRVYMGYEEADFPATAGVYDDDFCRPIGAPYKTVLRFEGIVVNVPKVQHPGEDNVQIKLVCSDWSALLAAPAALIGSWFPPEFAYPKGNDGVGIGGSEMRGFNVVADLLGLELGPRITNRLRVFRHRNVKGVISDYDLVSAYFWREGFSSQTGGEPIWPTRYGDYVFQWILEFAKFDCNLFFFRQGVPFYADYFTFMEHRDDSGPLFDGDSGTPSPVKTVDVYSDMPAAPTIEQLNRQLTPVGQSEERTAEAINAVAVWMTPGKTLVPAAGLIARDWDSLVNPAAVNYTAGVEHCLPLAGPQYQTTHGRGPDDQPIGEIIANQLLRRFKGRKPIRAMLQMKGQPDLWWGDRLPVHGGDIGLDGINVRPIKIVSKAEWQPGQRAGPYTTALIVAAEYTGIEMVP